MRSARVLTAVAAIACAAAVGGMVATTETTKKSGRIPYPETPRRAVTDTYHGVKVVDEYRWLENGADPEVLRWSESQNRLTRKILDDLPQVPAIRKRVLDLESFPAPAWYELKRRGGTTFAIKREPPKQQPFLVTLASVDAPGSERVLVDPNELDPQGGTSIDFYVPSRDGALVAVSLSKGGSEDGTLRLFEVQTGRELEDVIPRVNGGTAGGSVAWNADGTGFFYTRYPRDGERPPEDLDFYQQVYFHTLGTAPEKDTCAIGREFPRIAETELDASEDGRFLLASVANGDGGEYAHWLHGPDGTWTPLARFEDEVIAARFAPDGTLYLLSRKESPRGRILRLPPGSGTLAEAAVVVPQSESVIDTFLPTREHLFVADVLGGPSQIRVFDTSGAFLANVPIPKVTAVLELADGLSGELLFRSESPISPAAWNRYRVLDQTVAKTALTTPAPADYTDFEVVREAATSKDGTSVPMSVVRRRGLKLDGSNPTLLYGYGGYGIVVRPSFKPADRLWLEAGGVLAFANLRGGGEFGEAWHRAGNLTKKQNVFDDFLACAQRLIDLRYTRPDRLAIRGGSNGGLLMGAALTQEPRRFRAVVSFVGIYDMLRVELSPNGAFNVTEFGTVQNQAHFRALRAYSPYHRVRDGVAYPATLLLTGANDPRVDPMQSRKMAARLQAVAETKAPILLRTSNDSGHGIGSSLVQKVAETVDVYAFLFEQLGMAPPPSPARKPASP